MPPRTTQSPTQARTPRLPWALALFAIGAATPHGLIAQTTQHTASPHRAKAFVHGRVDASSNRPKQGAAALANARVQHLQLAASSQAASLTTPWTPVGPVQVQTSTYGLITGRVTAAAVDPADTTGNTVYLGTSGGGVWKSTTAAGTASSVQFKPLTDTLQAFSPSAGTSTIPSLSIGAISVQPGGTGVILAGTGDPNDASDSYYGSGLLRSADNGLTWSLTQYAVDGGGVHSFVGQGFAGFAWSTSSPQLVVAAVSSAAESDIVRDDQSPGVRGLYYSTDGGSTWNLATVQDGSTVIQNQYTNFSTFRGNAATAVVWNPIRKRFYAAVRFHGYYESTDGITWTRLTNQPGTGLTATNCPARSGDYGTQSCPIFRGALAAQTISGDLFALTVDVNNADQGLWQDTCSLTVSACASSTVTWSTQLNSTPMEDAGTIDQGDYNLTLAAIPAATALNINDTLLFAGAADLYRCSLSGGCTLRNTTNTSNGCASPAGVAPAQHAIAWQANLSDTSTPLLYIGNDGGLWRSTDGVRQTGSVCSPDDATHFDNLNGALGSLAEISSMSSHPTNASILLASLGGNGSAASTTSAQAANQSPWAQLSAGESGTVAIDQGDGNVWLAQSGSGVALHTCTNGTACTPADFTGAASVGLTQTGSDLSLVDPPALLDPVLNTNLILGTCRVWRGPTSGNSTWSSSNAISPFLQGPAASACNGSDATIRSLAAGGAAQLTNAAQTSGSPVLYAGLSGVADGGSTFGGRIFGTTGGNFATSTAAWTDLTASPVTNDPTGFNPAGFDISGIAVDPNDATGHTVYATILGFGYPHVYRSTNAGVTWTNISANLPNAPANAVAVDPNNALIVYVAMDTGVYVTTDVTSCIAANGTTVNCWTVLGTSLPNAPVLTLTASRGIGAGVLRAGTYGRGIWQQPLLSTGAASLPAATFSPTSLTFSTAQNVGTTSASQTVTLTNTGNTGMTIATVSASTGFIETDTCAGTSLAVNATCSIAVSFAPIVNGPITGTVQVIANVSGGYAAFSLNGTGIGMPNIALSPTSLTFASTAIGTTSATQTVTATNNGTAAATLSTPTATQDFQVASTTCGTTLAAGASCTLSISYAPTTTGANTGLLTVTDTTASHTVLLNGTGTGTASITVTPSSLTFPQQSLNVNATSQPIIVTNTGTATGTLGIPSFSAPQWFIAINTCESTLAPKTSCEIDVSFKPPAAGSYSGTLTVPAAGKTYTVSLYGSGVLYPDVSFLPGALTFPATAINSTASGQTVTFSNLGSSYINLTDGIAQVTGDFGVTVNNCTGLALLAGNSCTFTVIFSPTAAGIRTGQFIYSTSGQSYAVTLTGTGTGTATVGVSPSALNFPATNVRATSASQTITVSNTGNITSALSVPALSGDFALAGNTCGTTIAASTSCALSVVFTPSADGPRTGSLVLTDANTTHTIPLNGNGIGTANVALSPLSLLFPSTPVHTTSAAQTITISNTGTASTTLGTPAITGDFAITANTCATTIAAGASCSISVTFTPATSGSRAGTLSLADASATHTVTLSGGGTAGVLSLSATTLTFADTSLNATSPTQTVTLTNTGTSTLTVASSTASGDFAISSPCATTALAPGKSCGISLTFTPTATGVRTGTLTITSDSGSGAAGTQATVVLTGNGKGPFYVALLPTSANFGTQITGTVSSVINITISNTGAQTGALQSINVTGDFVLKANTCGTALASDTGCTVSVAFAPSVAGVRTGALTVVDDAGTQTATLMGTGTAAATDTLSPLSLTFPTQQVNTTSPSQIVTLTNTGDTPLTLVASQILTGDFAAVNNCGPTLTAHNTCGITVTFIPKGVGVETGTLQVSDVLHVQTVALSGTSIAGPGVSLLPNSLTFATTGVGAASAGQSLTLSNNGGVALQLSAINVTGDFGIIANSNTCSMTAPIAPGNSCSMQIAFVPSAAGARSGTVTVLSNAATQTTQLTGNGVDFALVANGPTSITIANGANAVYPLLLRPATYTSDAVTYACAGAPSSATCKVTSQYTDLSAISTVSVTVLSGTTAASKRLAAFALLLPMLCLPFCIGRKHSRRSLLALLLTAILIGSASCGGGRESAEVGDGSGSGGGGTNPVTPSGTYTITVSATAAGVTHSVPLTLIVQ